jgi:hypothetical protein
VRIRSGLHGSRLPRSRNRDFRRPLSIVCEKESLMESDFRPKVGIRDLVLYYLHLGALGFGGPVALCGQMERELVQERKWLSRDEMRDGIAVCESLPGPLAIQVGILVSYLLGGFGEHGLAAGRSFYPTSSSSQRWAHFMFISRGCRFLLRSSTA